MTGEALYELFAYQSGVPARATCHDNEAAGIEQTFTIVDDSRESYAVALHVYTSPHAVAQTVGLLKYLFQHEERIFAFLQLS